MKYLPNGEQMKSADQHTIRELSVPSLDLMERASGACVDFIKEHNFDLSSVCVVCGSGNNGGDGFAIARMLAKEGYRVQVVIAGNPDHFTEEAAYQFNLLKETDADVCDEFTTDEYSIIIDAVFGVGLSREVSGKYAGIIDRMNAVDAVKIAVDIPSGVSADTGAVLGTAFQADYTVTFQTGKLGLYLEPGRSISGKVHVADIGIDTSIFEKDMQVACTLEHEEYVRLLPDRKADSNKGTYGRLLVIAGSKGMSGAAYLNALAAYRTGAGLVRIYTPECNREILQQLLPEAIITTFDLYDEREILILLDWADAVCVGSGIGTGDRADRILRTVIENVEKPCVIDADGLTLLAKNKKIMKRTAGQEFVLTPHMKEFSRLTGKTVEELRSDRAGCLKTYTESYNMTCVLKDAATITLTTGGRLYVNCSGTAALAKAGSGDVLTGMIAGLLAQGTGCNEAAVAGVYFHGLAGEYAAREKGIYSVLAREVADSVGKAIKNRGMEYEEI